MKKIIQTLALILALTWTLSVAHSASQCIAKTEGELKTFVANPTSCTRDYENRYIIYLDPAPINNVKTLKLTSPININNTGYPIQLRPKNINDHIYIVKSPGKDVVTGVNIAGNGHMVRGLTVTGFDVGINVGVGDSNEAKDAIVFDCTLSANKIGIKIGAGNNQVLFNRIYAIKEFGIKFLYSPDNAGNTEIYKEAICLDEINLTSVGNPYPARTNGSHLGGPDEEDYAEFKIYNSDFGDGAVPANCTDYYAEKALELIGQVTTQAQEYKDCGIGASSKVAGLCVCKAGYELDQQGACTACKSGYYKNTTSGECLSCGGNKKVVNGSCVCDQSKGFEADPLLPGQCRTILSCPVNSHEDNGSCVCDDKYEAIPPGSTSCVEACAPGQTRDANFVCTCGLGKELVNGACQCSEGYAGDDCSKCAEGYGRYEGRADARCVKCNSSLKSTSDGQCSCPNTFHIGMKGNCVSSAVSCPSENANAVKNDGGDACVCKPGYIWSPGDAIGEYAPSCVEGGVSIDCNVPFNQENAPECDCSLDANKSATWCTGGGAQVPGDCGCSFGAAPINNLQVVLPYVVVAFGVGGLAVLRRRKR